MDFKKAMKAFDKYVSSYDMKDKNIIHKYRHTYKVVDLMEELANRLDLDDEKIFISKLIGLLHDIGRFEQLKQFSSYNDHATFDHADMSCCYLFEEGHIRDFVENDKYDKLIENAVRNHNKKFIALMDDESLFFSKMIRDMDKVDIYRGIAVDYETKFDAKEVSKDVLELFSKGEIIDRKLVKSESDEVLLDMGFVFDFNFEESLDILVETDNFDLYLGTVKVSEDSEKLWKKVREICFDKINKGIN